MSALVVDHVSKRFMLYPKPHHRLLGWCGLRVPKREFWALRDITFTLEPGEVFGIIGRNGAGKTTLLQLLAGILKPTSGRLEATGTVGSLIHLGTGFNLDLDGKENIYINGGMLGLSRSEIAERYDDIVEFAGLGEHLNKPVRTYSQGMFLRLAFAIATSFRPSVLLVDEILAVGDIHFRQRCYARLKDMRQQGTAMILVSHALNEIEDLCSRAMWLDNGAMREINRAADVVKRYYMDEQGSTARIGSAPCDGGPSTTADVPTDVGWPAHWPERGSFLIQGSVSATESMDFLGAVICDAKAAPCTRFNQGDELHLYHRYRLHRDIEVPTTGLGLRNDKGQLVHGKDSMQVGCHAPTAVRAGAELLIHQTMRLDVAVGEYTLETGAGAIARAALAQVGTLAPEEVHAQSLRLAEIGSLGPIIVHPAPAPAGRPRLRHHGMVELQGGVEIRTI